MRVGYLAVLALLAMLLVGCDPLSGVYVSLRVNGSDYAPTDTLVGTFAFVNYGPKRIHHEFSSGHQVDLRLYDWRHIQRLSSGYWSSLAVTYLELEPHSSRVDTFTFELSTPECQLEPGRYRLVGSMASHEGIHDGRWIEVR